MLEVDIMLNKGVDLDGSTCYEIVYNIAYQLYKYRKNIDFNIADIYVRFNVYGTSDIGLVDGEWANFDIGINIINSYFNNKSIKQAEISNKAYEEFVDTLCCTIARFDM